MREGGLIPLGIQGLDAQLGGGVPPGSLILLVGESTNALYTFMSEFAATGVGAKAPVHWFELDRPGTSVWGEVQRFVAGPITDGMSVVDTVEPSAAHAGANGHPECTHLKTRDVPDAVMQVMAAAGAAPCRIVVTSLTTLVDTMGVPDLLGFARTLSHAACASGGIVLLSMVAGAHPPEVVARLKHIATGVMEIGLERKGFGIYSFLKVEKLLGIPEATKLLLFSESDKGLRLESTRRVF